MNTGKDIILFELKLNMSSEAAMRQIDLKDYASKFALSGLPIVKVGINFDAERRTIGDWKIEWPSIKRPPQLLTLLTLGIFWIHLK